MSKPTTPIGTLFIQKEIPRAVRFEPALRVAFDVFMAMPDKDRIAIDDAFRELHETLTKKVKGIGILSSWELFVKIALYQVKPGFTREVVKYNDDQKALQLIERHKAVEP